MLYGAPKTKAGRAAAHDTFLRMVRKGVSETSRAYTERFADLDPETDWDDIIFFFKQYTLDLNGQSQDVEVDARELFGGVK